jgi:sulfoxide reductase heme-binding subunit YedZ
MLYLVLDAGGLQALREDLVERPYIALGLIGFALLVPLAATSNQAAMRLLGRQWRRLHTLSYLVAVLAIAHFWSHLKLGDLKALPYSLAMATLLASRLVAWKMGDRGPAAEVARR